MKNRQIFSLALAIGAGTVLVAPFTAHAKGPSHFELNEAGAAYHPGEAGLPILQAQVSAGLQVVKSQLIWDAIARFVSPLTASEGVGEASLSLGPAGELRQIDAGTRCTA